MKRNIVIVDDIAELRGHMRRLLESQVGECIVHEFDPLEHYLPLKKPLPQNPHLLKFCRKVARAADPGGVILLDHWFGLEAPWDGVSMLQHLDGAKVIATCKASGWGTQPVFAAKWKLEKGLFTREAQELVTLVRRTLGE